MKNILSEIDIVAQEKSWWFGRKFKHPETGNMVRFLSLPPEEQQKLNQYVKTNSPKEFEISKIPPQVPQVSPKKEIPQISRVPKENAPPKEKVPKEKAPKDEGSPKEKVPKEKAPKDEGSKVKKFVNDFVSKYDVDPRAAVDLIHFLESLGK